MVKLGRSEDNEESADESEERSVDESHESEEQRVYETYEIEEQSVDESEESVGNKESVNGRDHNNNDDDRDHFDESVDYEPCPDSPEHNTVAEFELGCNFDDEEECVRSVGDKESVNG